MMKEKEKKVEQVIIDSFRTNINLQKKIENLENQYALEKRAMLIDILHIIDAFEKAEDTIIEKGWDKTEQSEKSIKRLLTAKNKTFSILEKYQVSKINFTDNMCTDEDCKTVGDEPDSTKANGYIISIEKEGYRHGDKVLRYADVIIVKN